MTCLRVTVKDWTEENSGAFQPFVVQCYAETYDGKNCLHCNRLHKVCESVCYRQDSDLFPGVTRINLVSSLGP